MSMKKISKLFVIAFAVMGTGAALAKTTTQPTQPQMTKEQQVIAAICDTTAMGTATIATMHQSGVDKSVTLADINSFAPELEKLIGNAQVSGDIVKYWQVAVEDIYQGEILKTDEEKAKYVDNVGNATFYSCVEQLSKEQ